ARPRSRSRLPSPGVHRAEGVDAGLFTTGFSSSNHRYARYGCACFACSACGRPYQLLLYGGIHRCIRRRAHPRGKTALLVHRDFRPPVSRLLRARYQGKSSRLQRSIRAALSHGRGPLRRQGIDAPSGLSSLPPRRGVGIDVASPYETRCALEAGVPPEKLDVNGNSKDDDLINLAISKNMLIIADSIAELERIAQLAKNHQEAPRFVLRVTGFPLDKVTSPSIFTADEWSKFGIFISDIPPLLSRLDGMPVKLLGFHTHTNHRSCCLSARAWQAHRARHCTPNGGTEIRG